MSPVGSAHLGRHFRERRQALDLNQDEVAQAGGPSSSKQTEIEQARLTELTRLMARKIDRGLHWETGSARRVWDGGEPTPMVPGFDRADSRLLRRAIEDADLAPSKRDRLLRILDEVV